MNECFYSCRTNHFEQASHCNHVPKAKMSQACIFSPTPLPKQQSIPSRWSVSPQRSKSIRLQVLARYGLVSHEALDHRVALFLAGEVYAGGDVSFVRVSILGMAQMLDCRSFITLSLEARVLAANGEGGASGDKYVVAERKYGQEVMIAYRLIARRSTKSAGRRVKSDGPSSSEKQSPSSLQQPQHYLYHHYNLSTTHQHGTGRTESSPHLH